MDGEDEAKEAQDEGLNESHRRKQEEFKDVIACRDSLGANQWNRETIHPKWFQEGPIVIPRAGSFL